MVSEAKIKGLLAKYNDPSISAGERSTIRAKLVDLGVLKPESNALIPTNQSSNALVPYDPVMTPPTESQLVNALTKVSGPVGTAVAIGKQLADLNAAWGNPVGKFGKWVYNKSKKGLKKLVQKFTKKKPETPKVPKVPAIDAPPIHDVVDPVVQQERNIIASATTYPQMLPATLYKPTNTKWYAARAYESMLPRRRYRRGMFGHSVYNNMGFFNSFVSPSNRRFYY